MGPSKWEVLCGGYMGPRPSDGLGIAQGRGGHLGENKVVQCEWRRHIQEICSPWQFLEAWASKLGLPRWAWQEHVHRPHQAT